MVVKAGSRDRYSCLCQNYQRHNIMGLRTGCNVENASYGLTICAERTALVKAVSEGHRTFKAIAVASNMNDLTMPCGACRQFIIEFGKNIVVHSAAADGRVSSKRADELLPLSFGASDLPPK
nr:cytidine deaminase-like isoform X5 [Dermacentor andersoni]